MGAFFALEPLLIDRLSSKVTQARQIMSLADYAEARDGKLSNQLPALLVLFGGHRIADQRADAVKIRQTWVVVAIGKSVRQGADKAQQARESISDMVDSMVAALLGWRPSSDFEAMSMVDSGFQPDFDGHSIYVPIGFSTSLVLKGEGA